jgi:hypothetical protein
VSTTLIDRTLLVAKLSQLIIDADKDWATKNIKNFGPGGVDLYSLLTAHASRHLAGGDDALSGISRSQLEYPTVNVPIAYLFIIGKAFQDYTDGDRMTFIGTLDSFADKMIANAQLMKTAEATYYEGFYGRAQADPKSNSYVTRVATNAATADGILEKDVAGTATTLGTEAVDLSDDTAYIFGVSCSGSTIKRVRFNRWTASAGAISFGTATAVVSATDTTFASGRFLERQTNSGGPDNPAGLVAFLLGPASALEPAKAVVELDVEGSGREDDPFRPSVSKSLAEVSSLAGLPDFLYQEAKKYDMLKAKGFTDDEIKALFGYIPQHQVDLDAVTWGAFEFHPDKAPTAVVVITGDNPYKSGAIQRQIDFAKSKNLRVFSPPKDYSEAVALYNRLKASYPHWLAGKDNFAYQTLGWEILDWFQNVDFYYGELLDHKTHYNQLKQVSDKEITGRLNELIDKLSRETALVDERGKHIMKAKEVLARGW